MAGHDSEDGSENTSKGAAGRDAAGTVAEVAVSEVIGPGVVMAAALELLSKSRERILCPMKERLHARLHAPQARNVWS